MLIPGICREECILTVPDDLRILIKLLNRALYCIVQCTCIRVAAGIRAQRFITHDESLCAGYEINKERKKERSE